MESLKIEATEDCPQVMFDKQSGIFEISGRSFPEDSSAFYSQILNWISLYKSQPNESSTFVFKLEYSNTASSKFLLDIMMALRQIKGVHITWCCQEDDEDMQEAGKEYSEHTEIPFEFVMY